MYASCSCSVCASCAGERSEPIVEERSDDTSWLQLVCITCFALKEGPRVPPFGDTTVERLEDLQRPLIRKYINMSFALAKVYVKYFYLHILIFYVYVLSMKPYENNDEGVGMGEGDMSDGEAEALKRRLDTMKQLSKKRVDKHLDKMKKLVSSKRSLPLEGGQR